MNTAYARGFTLIELLTVIAIIAILAGIISVALPLAIEKAKIADVQGDFRAISTALTQYFTENQSYPPAYGFRQWPPAPDGPDVQYVETYTAYIGLFGALDLYDRFSTNYDANQNKRIDLMEYAPYNPGTDTFLPEDTKIYDGTLGVVGRMSREQRPYIYAPYFSKQLDKLKRAIKEGGNEIWDGLAWNANFDSSLGYPPPRYDGFVLISVGPGGNTFGVASPPDEGAFLSSVSAASDDSSEYYNILALRAAYLATRDVNNNGLPDFDFLARTRKGEGKTISYSNPNYRFLPTAPTDERRAGLGPLIYESQ